MSNRRHQEDQAEQKMARSVESLQDRSGQDPHRPRPPRPPRPGAGRLLRLDDADQPGGQRHPARCAHDQRAAVGEEHGREIEKAIRESDLGLNPARRATCCACRCRRSPRSAAGSSPRSCARRRGRQGRGAQRAPRRQRARQEAAQGQGDHRRRGAARAGRDAEAHRPHDRRDRPAGRRRRKPRSWRSERPAARSRRRARLIRRSRTVRQPMTEPAAASSRRARAVVPRHVAIVMDGNGRWAKQRFMPRFFGHKRASMRWCARCRPAPTAASSTSPCSPSRPRTGSGRPTRSPA